MTSHPWTYPLAACLLTFSLLAPDRLMAANPVQGAADAPDFTRTDIAGVDHTLSGLRGRVVVLNFWATWCAPCLQEMPQFAQWQHRYGPRGLQILGISMDDSPDPVRRLARQRPPGYPLIMGDAALAKLYGGVYGLPTTFLIDPRGKIVARYRGSVNLAELESRIRAILPPDRAQAGSPIR